MKNLEQNIKPTHIVNYLNYKGEITEKVIEYKKNSAATYLGRFIMEPEDFEKDAGTKFKIGDIVKVKRNIYRPEIDTNDKLYVVRYLPKKVEGQQYFNNKYALISDYSDELWRDLKNGHISFDTRPNYRSIEEFKIKKGQKGTVLFCPF